MTVPTSEESVRTSGDSAWTVVDSVSVPTSRVASILSRSFTCSTIARRIHVLNPCNSTETSYVPGTRNGAV